MFLSLKKYSIYTTHKILGYTHKNTLHGVHEMAQASSGGQAITDTTNTSSSGADDRMDTVPALGEQTFTDEGGFTPVGRDPRLRNKINAKALEIASILKDQKGFISDNPFSLLNEKRNADFEPAASTKKIKNTPRVRPVDIVVGSPDEPGKFTYSAIHKIIKSAVEFPPQVWNVSRDRVRVSAHTIEDYRKLLHALRDNKIEHMFLSSEADKKPIKVVIRGLPMSTKLDDIQEDLQDQGFPVETVGQMKSLHKKKARMPLFLVTLRDDAKARSILELRAIMYTRITIEDYRAPREPRQCFTCQRFDHVSANCQANPRCVKCGQAHASKACPTQIEQAQLKCANCGGNHAANYRGCDSYKVAKKRVLKRAPKSDKVEKLPSSKARESPRARPLKGTYANAVTKKPVPQNQKLAGGETPAVPFDFSHAPTALTQDLPFAFGENNRSFSGPSKTATPKNVREQQSPVTARGKTISEGCDDDFTALMDMISKATNMANSILSGKMNLREAAVQATAITGQLITLSLRFAKQNGE